MFTLYCIDNKPPLNLLIDLIYLFVFLTAIFLLKQLHYFHPSIHFPKLLIQLALGKRASCLDFFMDCVDVCMSTCVHLNREITNFSVVHAPLS